LEKSATHDDLYDETFYLTYTAQVGESAHGIVNSIMQHMAPKSLIDVGCGSGEIIDRFRDVGVTVYGCDYSDAALRICRAKNLNVAKIDLEGDIIKSVKWRADVVISTEVAEHIAASCADNYVKLLCRTAERYIVITAATPGQGGTHHINEQPNDYWIEMFKQQGAIFFNDLTRTFRQEWKDSGVDGHRANNVLVFRPV